MIKRPFRDRTSASTMFNPVLRSASSMPIPLSDTIQRQLRPLRIMSMRTTPFFRSAKAYLLALITSSTMMRFGAAVFWIWFGSAALASARAHYKGVRTAEGWAWSRIKRGERADFNLRCRTTPLDPKDEEDPRWQNSCRKLSSRFLEEVLTQSPRRESIPSAGVRIAGARIVENIDLANAKLIRPIEVVESRIEGAVILDRTHTDSLIVFDGSLVAGEVTAQGLHARVICSASALP
jgi:hypothetical protein